MRIAVILPHLPDLSGESGTSSISGASIALKVFLRLYANDPGVETLELFVAPRDLLNPAAIRKLAADLLEPSNLGKGKLEFHSLYSLPELWSDGHARVIHTDDLHALARDRDLRDRFATGPTVIACDIHCMGHRSISDSIRLVAQMPSNRFDRIYATSHASARSTEATFKAIGAPGHTVIEVRPRMIDGTGLRPCANPGEKAALRRTLGFSESDVVALVVGRMTPATKADFVVLTEVFAAQSRPSHHLVIAGHEEIIGYGKTVYDTAVKHGAAGRVHVRGGFGIGARGDLYRASDFLVFPADSGNEVFGQAAVEAMACGIPVLATDWDGLKDTVEDGVTGIRVPTYAPPRLGRFDSLTSVADDLTTLLLRAQATVVDRSAFGSAFEKLLNDAELRARMGIAGAAVFHTKFLPEML